MQVGVTNAAGHDFHQSLARPWIWNRNFSNLQRLAELFDESRFHRFRHDDVSWRILRVVRSDAALEDQNEFVLGPKRRSGWQQAPAFRSLSPMIDTSGLQVLKSNRELAVTNLTGFCDRDHIRL
jgi:hypothetical protein